MINVVVACNDPRMGRPQRKLSVKPDKKQAKTDTPAEIRGFSRAVAPSFFFAPISAIEKWQMSR